MLILLPKCTVSYSFTCFFVKMNDSDSFLIRAGIPFVSLLTHHTGDNVDWKAVLSSLTPKPKKDDPLTKQERELLDNPALVGLNTVTMSLMMKLGLVLVDPRIYWAADLDEMPGGTLALRRTQLFQLKNAFFRGAQGQNNLAPNPNYTYLNPGPRYCDYVDGIYLFEYVLYVRSLGWVSALPAGTHVCEVHIAVADAGLQNNPTLFIFPITSS